MVALVTIAVVVLLGIGGLNVVVIAAVDELCTNGAVVIVVVEAVEVIVFWKKS